MINIAELRIDTDYLHDDVEKAQAQLKTLENSAKSLAETFDKIGVKNGFGTLSQELQEMRKSMKTVTESFNKDFQSAIQKVADGVNKLSSVTFGNFGFDESTKQNISEVSGSIKDLSNHMKKLTVNNIGEQFTKEIDKIEAEAKRVTRELAQTALLNATFVSNDGTSKTGNKKIELEEKTTKRLKQELLAQINNTREAYKQGELDAIQYYKKLETLRNMNEKIENDKSVRKALKNAHALTGDSEIEAKRREAIELRKISEESALNLVQTDKDAKAQRLADEVEFKKKSEAISGSTLLQTKYMEESAHKEKIALLNKTLEQENLTAKDRKQLTERLLSEEKKLHQKHVKEVAAINKGLYNASIKDYETTANKFRSLTEYAFDASIIYGTINAVQQLIGVLADVEEQMVGIQRVLPSEWSTDLKESTASQLTSQAFNIAKDTGLDVNQIMDIENQWARASDAIASSAEAMEELTEVASAGVQVGGFEDATQAVTLLNSTINQMGLSWTDAESVMNSWVKTADVSAVGSAKDLADMISRVGTQANMLGLTYHDLNGMVAMFANNMSRSGAEIGTAMKTVFSYFEDDSTIKVLDKYGVAVRKNEKEFHNFNYIMQQLNDTFKELELDNNAQGIAELSNALGRIRRRDYVGVLLNHWEETKYFVLESMNSLNDETSYVEKQQELMAETLKHKISTMTTAFKELAWSIGEAGLMEDIKSMVSGITSVAQAINDIDPSTKRFLSTMLEISATALLVNKSLKLAFGTSTGQMLSNLIADMGNKLNNEKLFNIGVQGGQSLYQARPVESQVNLAEKVAVDANTASTKANTIATNENSASKKANAVGSKATVASKTQETVTTNANTVALGANAAAQKAQTTASLTLANAQRVGGGVAGMLGSAVAGLFNPITLVTTALTIGVSAFTAYNEKKRQSIELAKELKAQEEKLRAVLSQEVVTPDEVATVESIADKVKEATKNYEAQSKVVKDLNDKITATQAGMTKINEDGTVSVLVDNEAYNQLSLLHMELDKAKEKLEEYDLALGQLGTNSNSAKDHLKELESLILRSGDATVQNSYALRQEIEQRQEFNLSVRDLIKEYKELSVTTQSTYENEDRLKQIIQTLGALYPSILDNMDHVTDIRKLDFELLSQQIMATDTFTESQITELSNMVQLTKAGQDHARSTIQNQINATRATIEQSQARINAMQAELDAFNKLKSATDIAQESNTFNGMTIKTGNIALDRLLPENMIEGEKKKLEEHNQSLETYLEQLEVINKTTTFDPSNYNTPLANDGDDKKNKSASKAAEQYNDAIDLTKERLEKINSQLNIQKTILDGIGDYEATRSQRAKIMNNILDLQSQKLSVLRSTNSSLGSELSTVNSRIEKYIKGWSNMTDDQKMKAYNSLSDESKKKVSTLVSKYVEFNKELRSTQEEMASLTVEINEQQKAIKQLDIDYIVSRWSRLADSISKLGDFRIDGIKRAIDLEKEHQETIKQSVDNADEIVASNAKLLELYGKQYKQAENNRKRYNDNLYTLNNQIEKHISGWNKMTADQKMAKITTLTDEQKERLGELVELWVTYTDGMKEAEDSMREINKAITDTNDNSIDTLTNNIKLSREYQKQIASKRLEAKQQMEINELQKAIYGSTEEQYLEYMQSAVNVQEELLAAKKAEREEQEQLNALLEKRIELDKIKNDTRFAYIDEATGKEIYTYDRGAYNKALKEYNELVDKQAFDDEVTAIEDLIDSLEKEIDAKEEQYKEQLKILEDFHKVENESFDKYWEQRLSDESIYQDALNQIKAMGLDGAIKNSQKYYNEYKGILNGYNSELIVIGEGLNSSLFGQIGKDLDAFTSQKSLEMYNLGKALKEQFLSGLGGGSYSAPASTGMSVSDVKAQMEANSKAWHTASASEKKQLEQANQALGKSIGGSYNSLTGKWTLPTYHSGGFVGGTPIDPRHEEIAKMLKGELVLTKQNLDSLLTGVSLSSLPSYQATTNSSKVSAQNSTQSISIRIDKIEANDLNQLLQSLDPYIVSRS